MGVYISKITPGSWPVLRIDGKLVKEDLAELKKVCQSVTGPLALDLSNLLWADHDGVRALLKLEQNGTWLQGVSPLLALLLWRGKPG